MMISSAAFSMARRCGGVPVRCFSLATQAPWPRIQNKESPPPRIPYLMLPSPTNPSFRSFYQLEENNEGSTVMKPHDEIFMPELEGRHCIGSANGFVFGLSVHHFGSDIVAVNPLSGGKLRLPSIRNLAHHIPVDPKGEEDSDNFLSTVHSKLILSTSLDIAVLIRRSRQGSGYAHFARLKPMDGAWTPIPLPIPLLDDCIFHKDRFIAVNHAGDFTTFNDTGDPSKPEALIHCSDRKLDVAYHRFRRTYRKYLVESPDGDDLFLVCRKGEDEDKESALESEGNDGDEEPAPQRKRCFSVLRLDKNDRYMWKPVDSLGGLAFFVGPTQSFCLPTADLPCLKPDSIYFTMDLRLRDLHFQAYSGLGHTGVFNLKDGTVQLFRLAVDTRNGGNWLPPTWVGPTAC